MSKTSYTEDQSQALGVCRSFLDLRSKPLPEIKSGGLDLCRRIIVRTLGPPEIFSGEILECIKRAEMNFNYDFYEEAFSEIEDATVKIARLSTSRL